MFHDFSYIQMDPFETTSNKQNVVIYWLNICIFLRKYHEEYVPIWCRRLVCSIFFLWLRVCVCVSACLFCHFRAQFMFVCCQFEVSACFIFIQRIAEIMYAYNGFFFLCVHKQNRRLLDDTFTHDSFLHHSSNEIHFVWVCQLDQFRIYLKCGVWHLLFCINSLCSNIREYMQLFKPKKKYLATAIKWFSQQLKTSQKNMHFK